MSKSKVIKKKKSPRTGPVIQVGHSKESLKERLNGILAIINTDASDQVKMTGLNVFKDLGAIGPSSISDCNFTIL